MFGSKSGLQLDPVCGSRRCSFCWTTRTYAISSSEFSNFVAPISFLAFEFPQTVFFSCYLWAVCSFSCRHDIQDDTLKPHYSCFRVLCTERVDLTMPSDLVVDIYWRGLTRLLISARIPYIPPPSSSFLLLCAAAHQNGFLHEELCMHHSTVYWIPVDSVLEIVLAMCKIGHDCETPSNRVSWSLYLHAFHWPCSLACSSTFYLVGSATVVNGININSIWNGGGMAEDQSRDHVTNTADYGSNTLSAAQLIRRAHRMVRNITS